MERDEEAAVRSLADRLADPSFHQYGDPWQAWREIRVGAGMTWSRERDGPGFWSVTRYAAAAEVLTDWQRFSSVPGTTLEGNRWQDDPASGQMLPLMDPPLHDLLRRHLTGEFTAARIAVLAAHCRGEVERLASQALEQGCVDINETFAVPLPIYFAQALLGIHASAAPALTQIIRGTLSCDETERAIADAELILFLQELIDARRRSPGDDLIGRLCATKEVTDALPGNGLLLTIANLLSAGLTTTRLAINGAFEAFARHPDHWQALRRGVAPRKLAVEEVLRWTSPALAVVRTARAPAQLCGRAITAGDRVVVWLPSANRDEAVFPQADTFLAHRPSNFHLAFGTGIHKCLGMALARLELGILLDVTARRWGSIAIVGKPVRFRSLVLTGIDQLRLAVSRPDGR